MTLTAPVFNLQTLATRDGPGIRTVIFLKNCPLKCSWCSNPEGQTPSPQLQWHKTRCKGCLNCRNLCPNSAVNEKAGHEQPIPEFNRNLCINCKTTECIEGCPGGALGIIGKDMTDEEVFQTVRKDTKLFWNSGGGVTFSGGEPMLYPDFLKSLISSFRTLSIHTTIETCGLFDWEQGKQVLDMCNLVFFDIKTLDDDIHRKFTGISNRIILENLSKLTKDNPEKVIISIPVIPGVNDTPKDIARIGDFLVSENAGKARLLPYHNWAKGKYDSLNIPYPHEPWDRMIPESLLLEMKQELENRKILVTIE